MILTVLLEMFEFICKSVMSLFKCKAEFDLNFMMIDSFFQLFMLEDWEDFMIKLYQEVENTLFFFIFLL